MLPTKIYVCSQPNCNQTFTKFADLKKHESEHARPGKYVFILYATLVTYTSSHLVRTPARFPGYVLVHYRQRSHLVNNFSTGEKRYGCPHDCTFRTHNPSALARHRKEKHGYVPPPRNTRGGAAAPSASEKPPSNQPSALSYQTHPNSQDPSFNVLYGPTDTWDDYTMFTGPARTADGWTEGCMCPELMQRRLSEILGYENTHY
ncbi:hypothetical protein DEU56DRAFT_911710 [Suillus clintonianus]|uniref:uncharacterized protein n=1 Tax=Suillus clintonianus TaxID=1904413 RepID=UPI001B86A71C|nr:uncharacterized protein DEU56DRAFT_911710 [Suillus clintonianus]KAG2140643.1 hypothetical protein DEU56DRAFT_911710 [Suillus clintonianus]